MPFNKPALRFCSCSCNALAGLPQYASTLITSSLRPSPSSSPCVPSRSPLRQDSHRCRYATIKNGSRDDPAHSQGPPWPKNPNPTPYEILSVRHNNPYTKHRFHELVKTYHPDRHTYASDIQSLPKATRLERYRLIVAANDLLSDPSKRRLYDTHGVGWTGDRAPTLNESARHAEYKWRDQPGNASRNATWEDWERWYNARDGKPQESPYASNGFFATLVVMSCMIGAFAHMSYADQVGAKYMEMRDQSNLAIGQQMARNTLVASGRTKDERVDCFLRDRENVNFSFSPSKHDNWPTDEAGHESEQRPQS